VLDKRCRILSLRIKCIRLSSNEDPSKYLRSLPLVSFLSSTNAYINLG
jgi:hypothetical protein